jgi:multicomponent Na+:H+ antiporter subunit C
MIASLPYLIVGLLFLFGLYAVVFERNLIKIAIGISVIEAATNMFLIVLGYRTGGRIPVFTLAERSRFS